MPARKPRSSRSRRAWFEALELREVLSTTIGSTGSLGDLPQAPTRDAVAVSSGLASSLESALGFPLDELGDRIRLQPFVPPDPGQPPTPPAGPISPSVLSRDDHTIGLRVDGRGFFLVEGRGGRTLLTRDGNFHVNADHELVNRDGLRVLGYSVDADGRIDRTAVVPLTIPLGRETARATENVILTGTLSPEAETGTHPQIVQSQSLGDGLYEAPDPWGQFTADDIVPATAPGGVDEGNYSYRVTFLDTATGLESRPTPEIGPVPIEGVGRHIRLTNLPQPDRTDSNGRWDAIRIYRNVARDATAFYEVATVPVGQSIYTDAKSDAEILTTGNPLDPDGPRLSTDSFVVNMLIRNGELFHRPFAGGGTLSFFAYRNGRPLPETQLKITAGTTVAQLLDFLDRSLGIHATSTRSGLPLPGEPGVSLADGQIRVTSNLGVENAIGIGLVAFQFRELGASQRVAVPLIFRTLQESNGDGATANATVYDSLGMPIHISVSTVIEAKTGADTRFRWYAHSWEESPAAGFDVALGNGLLMFDNEGQLKTTEPQTIRIPRDHTAAQSPLEITLEFGEVSGLARRSHLNQPISQLVVRRQDGYPPGFLDRFIVDADGLIRGESTNGSAQPLGQLLLASVPNPRGLRRVGRRLYDVTPESGPTTVGEPGEGDLGELAMARWADRPADRACIARFRLLRQHPRNALHLAIETLDVTAVSSGPHVDWSTLAVP